MQVPFFVDLVTPVNPCSKFSYMNYLVTHQKLFRFAIRENYFVKRNDYNNYCRWVAAQLPNLHFNHHCKAIHFDEKNNLYEIITSRKKVMTKNIVLGIDTVPASSSFIKNIHDPLVLHSGDYLFRKEILLQQKKISSIGSGQSAAEIFYDLLKTFTGNLDWFTKSEGFIPMDYSKFALEKTSWDYINNFFHLPEHRKSPVLQSQNFLYKGINEELLSNIYELLDDSAAAAPVMHPGCELKAIEPGFALTLNHLGMQQTFRHSADAVILATSYKATIPSFIDSIRHMIIWDKNKQHAVNRNYSIDSANSIFVQNADCHSHGFNSADLGMGPYRNATIIKTVLGREHYKFEKGITFQNFGMP